VLSLKKEEISREERLLLGGRREWTHAGDGGELGLGATCWCQREDSLKRRLVSRKGEIEGGLSGESRILNADPQC